MNTKRRWITAAACLAVAAAFAANARVFIHGGWSLGLLGVSAAFVVLATLALLAWRRSRPAMCMLTVLFALCTVGAGVLLANSLGAPMYDSLLVPFVVFLIPFCGVTGALTPLAGSVIVTAVCLAWLTLSAWFWHEAAKAGV